MLRTLGIAAALSFFSGYATGAEERPHEYRRSGLLERPPFFRSEKVATGTGQAQPLVLRGFFGRRESPEVSLTRSDTGQSEWVRVGDKTAKWFVESADPPAGTATVSYEGATLHLKLASQAEARPVENPLAGVVAIDYTPTGPDTRGDWGRMKQGGREAFRLTLMAENAKMRAAHPELFDGRELSANEQSRRDALMRESVARAREAAEKAPQE